MTRPSTDLVLPCISALMRLEYSRHVVNKIVTLTTPKNTDATASQRRIQNRTAGSAIFANLAGTTRKAKAATNAKSAKGVASDQAL